MKKTSCRHLLGAGILLLAGGLSALAEAQPPDTPSYLIFQLDNDLFTGSDRDYTNGARLAYMRPIDKEKLNRFQEWLQDLTGSGGSPVFAELTSFINADDVQYDWGLGLTQLMFTPQDPEALEAPPGQRPYAGWLGTEFSLHAKDSQALSSVIFSVGITGKYSLAEETQEWVHRNISNSPIFQGWDSQIPAELTLNLNFDRKHRMAFLSDRTRDWLIEFDGYLEWGAALGNFRTDAYVGSLFRAGYNLPVQYMTPRIRVGSYSHSLFIRDGSRFSNISIYAFGGLRGSAVLHDITLDGPVFRSHDSPVSSESWVGEALVGFGLRLGQFSLTYSRTFRTEEFDSQETGHQFGSIQAGIGF
ncbi:MAG: lipid A deacylase LpxR family protein [Puniceicoccaceae bacterium]